MQRCIILFGISLKGLADDLISASVDAGHRKEEGVVENAAGREDWT